MSFGQKLKLLREDRKMLQAELAQLLNLAPSSISMYEKDERDPDTSTVKRIAEIFNVSTDYLLGVEKNNNIDEPIEIAASTEDHIDIADLPDSAKDFIKDIINKYKNLEG